MGNLQSVIGPPRKVKNEDDPEMASSAAAAAPILQQYHDAEDDAQRITQRIKIVLPLIQPCVCASSSIHPLSVHEETIWHFRDYTKQDHMLRTEENGKLPVLILTKEFLCYDENSVYLVDGQDTTIQQFIQEWRSPRVAQSFERFLCDDNSLNMGKLAVFYSRPYCNDMGIDLSNKSINDDDIYACHAHLSETERLAQPDQMSEFNNLERLILASVKTYAELSRSKKEFHIWDPETMKFFFYWRSQHLVPLAKEEARVLASRLEGITRMLGELNHMK